MRNKHQLTVVAALFLCGGIFRPLTCIELANAEDAPHSIFDNPDGAPDNKSGGSDQPSAPQGPAPEPAQPDPNRNVTRHKIAFILDASAEAAPMLPAMKAELAPAIEGLRTVQDFSIYWTTTGGGFGVPATPDLLPAEPDNKRRALDELKTIRPGGDAAGIVQAVRIAGGKGAELIYLLLDGKNLYADLSDKLAKINESHQSKINVIMFVTEENAPATEVGKQIARTNGGIYKHVLVSGDSGTAAVHPVAPPLSQERPITPPSATELKSSRREIPPAITLAHSRENLSQLFAEEMKDPTPSGRRKLAAHLFDMVANTADNPADQYVLLIGAFNAAKQGGDLRLASRAADRLSQMFEVDGLALKTDAALSMKLSAANAADTVENSHAALELLDALIAKGDLPSATRLCELLKPLESSDPALPPLVLKRSKEISALRASYEQFEQASKTLKTNPQDATANLAVGRYYCFAQGAWDKGLAYLARGSDVELKKAASEEISSGKNDEEIRRIGDVWWAVGEKRRGTDGSKAREHAGTFYRQLLSGATGLNREVLVKRLAELDAQASSQTPDSTTGRGRAVTPLPRDSEQGAIILFGGKDASRWDPPWRVSDGVMISDGRDTYTREKFTNYKLHLEFIEPRLGANVRGQDRGNSGVFLQDRYEIQILDSYANPTYQYGGCAAIFGFSDPLKNVPRPPGEWQRYDITFHAARFQDGHKIQNARVTVYWNGELVQDNFEIPGITNGVHRPEYEGPGYVSLQRMRAAAPVGFRNIWIVPID